MKKIIPVILLGLSLIGSGCHKRVPTPRPPAAPAESTLQDLQFFPQNLEIYAAAAGKDKILLPANEQNQLARKFLNIYFGPWEMRKTSISRSEASQPFRYPRGYKFADVKWSADEWTEMRLNADLSAFPAMRARGITVRNTDLRELPTHVCRFSEPTPDPKINPFDYFQYSFLPVGMPVFIAHISLDKRWFYIECPIAGGWVDAKDVAFVDDAFASAWRSCEFCALIKDKVKPLPDREGCLLNIGTLLPLRSRALQNKTRILLPIKKDSGYAAASEATVAENAVALWPLTLTPGNAAKVGNEMMDQNYGWGGMFGDRDCSSMIRDIFTPFGLWLPRNSAAQAKRGAIIPLSHLDEEEKNNVIIRQGTPFLSLVGMKGHICLYVGVYKNRAAIFHNVWGVRIVENGDDDARFVIGKAVVTSISPGKELKNLYLPKTFVSRLRSLTNLP